MLVGHIGTCGFLVRPWRRLSGGWCQTLALLLPPVLSGGWCQTLALLLPPVLAVLLLLLAALLLVKALLLPRPGLAMTASPAGVAASGTRCGLSGRAMRQAGLA
jgi:hypothetical protein